MRLLNTKTLKLKEFHPDDIPRYAILSHTWGKQEVTFQDIQNLKVAKTKAGFAKVGNVCARARKYEFEWIWIDSCCINKESSAELSEAINSMYQYYLDAVVCYVYLSDVTAEHPPRDPKSNFRKSRWFTRGWTLQELLAPEYVVFLDKEWNRIGTRWSLRDVIAAITFIPVEVFEGRRDIDEYSVAQKMSWAALRMTTRPEDQAYCLMGIFGVSMPPIYGEGGDKAFMRLQQEIIKISDDRSIFAWVAPEYSGEEERGLLARSPFEFRMSGEIKASNSDILAAEKSSYSFGNNGLRIHLPLVPADVDPPDPDGKIFFASLHCQSERDGSYISVYLQQTRGHRYVRCMANLLVLRPSDPSLSAPESMHEITVKENSISRQRRKMDMPSSAVVCVELLPSAQHFTCATKRSSLSTDSESVSSWMSTTKSDITENMTVVELGTGSVVLKYKSRTPGESFSIILADRLNQICHFLVLLDNVHNVLDDNRRSVDRRKDRILGRLNNSDFCVSIACEMAGSSLLSYVLEVDYIRREEAFLARTLRPSMELGFMVPSNLKLHYPEYYTPEGFDIFPPHVFSKRFDDGKTCITISDNINFSVTDQSNTSTVFGILKYNGPFSGTIVYIALGFQGSTAWMDIIPFDHDSSESIQDIWKSYFDSGQRAEKRLNCQTCASVGGLTASVHKRTNLQVGTHFLCFTEDDHITEGTTSQTQSDVGLGSEEESEVPDWASSEEEWGSEITREGYKSEVSTQSWRS